MRYYSDPATGEPHIYGHGVSETEVEDVLGAPGEDRPGRAGSRIATGQTQDGRYLRVIYAPSRDADGLFVITAYELHGKPLRAFVRRMKRKRR
ncbi:MAG: DUF4258 domain-containing protein [Acidobacteria bacterium]|nr:DUF4258 domain-containing protein [Acidobacteriota bacterium]